MTDPYYSASLSEMPRIDFYSKRELEEWLSNEEETWRWLWTVDALSGTIGPDNFEPIKNSFVHIKSQLQPLSSEKSLIAQSLGRNFDNPFHNLFAGRGQNTLHASSSEKGLRVLDIRRNLGCDAARWHLLITTRQLTIQNAADSDDLALVIGGLVYNEAWAGDVGATLKQERANYRAAITKLENRVRELEDERRSDRSRLSTTMRRLANRRLSKYRVIWKNGEASIAVNVAEAIASITETEDKYRNQMALRAPVEYWRDKARAHGKWETVYAIVTVIFFVLAAAAVFFMAQGAIDFLKGFAGENETSAYIITSAALLAGTTLIFWFGRVIVKLFLSEHHLRSDCQEKAVMTEAYLAMTEVTGTLEETERAIILASVFRSSPDGIVKDEGPVDFGAAAILGKALSR